MGGALNENEVARENRYILPMLQKVKQYTVVSKGEIAGNFMVDNVKFGGGLSCDVAYIPEGKFVTTGNNDNTLLLSSFNQGSGSKFVPLKNIPKDVIKDLTRITGEKLLNAKYTESSNINLSTLKFAYVKAYDTNIDGVADLFTIKAVSSFSENPQVVSKQFLN